MKKLSFLFLLVLMCFGLVGCVVAENNPKTKEDEPKETNPTEGDEYDFATPFNKVVNLIGKDGVKDNINLPTSVGEVVFVWSSSDETVCTSRGVITRGLEDKEVTLTALMMVNGGKQATMSFTIKVLKTDAKIDKISDVLNADLTQSVLPSFSVLGTVIGVSSSSFLIQDETGMILVYRGYTWEHELVVGDTVLVAGTPTTYSGTIQFDGNATYTKTGTDSSFVQPNPKEVSGADLNKYVETLEHDYVKFTGTLSISGNYYNVAVEGANVTGSIVGPLVSDIDQMNGKEVTVTGYVLYLTGSGRFLNVLATSVEGDTTPIETTKKTIGEILEGPLGAYETEATVVAFNAQSFLISDGTGLLLVYRGRNWSQDVKVGQKVTLNGTVSVYNDVKQFEASATYELGEEGEYNAPNPKELTAAECDAFKEKCEVTYVKVTGKLAISGNYVNFTIPGATISGSVAYPIEDLSGLDGKWVEVTGYVLYTQSQGKYLSILATSVVETEEPSIPTPGPTEGATIAQVLAGELGDYEASGTVAAFNAQGFLLEDQGSFIFVYRGRDFAKDVAVGDKVKISGAVTVYNNVKQFGTDATYEKTASGSYNQPNARTLTAQQCDAYKDNCKVEYVIVVGQLAISGNYVNFTIPGATITGSVAYSIEDLSGFDGKWVKVTGYVLYTTSQGKYLNIIATSVVEAEEPVITIPEVTVSDIVNGADGTYECVATVAAIYPQGFFVTDGTNYVIVYRGRSWQCDLVEGDEVQLTGAVELYNGGKEFKSDAQYVKTGKNNTVDLGQAKAALHDYFEEVADSEQVVAEYIEFDGLLNAASDKLYVKVSESLVNVVLLNAVDEYNSLDGKYVKVTGFAAYTDAAKKNLNVFALSCVETEGEYVEPTIEIPEDAIEGTDFDLEATFDKYGSLWSSSYELHEIKTYEMGYKEQYSIELSRANKQGQTITTMPVVAANDKNTPFETVTVTGDFSNFTKVTFSLVQWTTKTFANIHIEYTTDGTTWIKCSEDITTPAALSTNVSIQGALKVRLVITAGKTSNVQIGIQKVTIE